MKESLHSIDEAITNIALVLVETKVTSSIGTSSKSKEELFKAAALSTNVQWNKAEQEQKGVNRSHRVFVHDVEGGRTKVREEVHPDKETAIKALGDRRGRVENSAGVVVHSRLNQTDEALDGGIGGILEFLI